MKQTLRLPLIPALLAYVVGLYLGHWILPLPLQGLIFLILLLFSFWAFFMLMKKTG